MTPEEKINLNGKGFIANDDKFNEGKKQMNWIQIEEKQPEKDGRYLVCEKHMYKWVGVCSFRRGKWDHPITHWMELPIHPNKEVK